MLGTGDFRGRALATAGRWVARAGFVALFVGAGLSLAGAVAAVLAATAVDVAIGAFRARIPLRAPGSLDRRDLVGRSIPIFGGVFAISLATRLDLFALQALGAEAAAVGYYAAAHTIAQIPILFSATFGHVTISVMTRATVDGDERGARDSARATLRIVVLLVPYAAVAASAAGPIMTFIYGPSFAPAAPALSVLAFAGASWLVVAVAMSVLVAAGRASMTVWMGALPLVLSGVAYLTFVPAFGAPGAYAVSATSAAAAAVLSLAAVSRTIGAAPSALTVGRSALVALAAAACFAAARARGLGELTVVAAICLLIPVGFVLLGEFDARDLAALRSLASLRGPRQGAAGRA
jgi:putative peptidoglycan lipid II flippase